MISNRLPAFPEPDQDKNKERRPSNEQRAHEPVAKFEDVVDLIPMG
jgi:hypothetical protein